MFCCTLTVPHPELGLGQLQTHVGHNSGLSLEHYEIPHLRGALCQIRAHPSEPRTWILGLGWAPFLEELMLIGYMGSLLLHNKCSLHGCFKQHTCTTSQSAGARHPGTT